MLKNQISEMRTNKIDLNLSNDELDEQLSQEHKDLLESFAEFDSNINNYFNSYSN